MPTEEFVTIYADRDFKGGSQKLQPGRYNLDYGPVGDNNISSVRIPEGWTVTMYDGRDFTGTSREFTASASSLGEFDNIISSISIRDTTARQERTLTGKFEDLVLAMVDPHVDFLAKELNRAQ